MKEQKGASGVIKNLILSLDRKEAFMLSVHIAKGNKDLAAYVEIAMHIALTTLKN